MTVFDRFDRLEEWLMKLRGASQLDIEIKRLKRNITRTEYALEDLCDCSYNKVYELESKQERRRAFLKVLETRKASK